MENDQTQPVAPGSRQEPGLILAKRMYSKDVTEYRIRTSPRGDLTKEGKEIIYKDICASELAIVKEDNKLLRKGQRPEFSRNAIKYDAAKIAKHYKISSCTIKRIKKEGDSGFFRSKRIGSKSKFTDEQCKLIADADRKANGMTPASMHAYWVEKGGLPGWSTCLNGKMYNSPSIKTFSELKNDPRMMVVKNVITLRQQEEPITLKYPVADDETYIVHSPGIGKYLQVKRTMPNGQDELEVEGFNYSLLCVIRAKGASLGASLRKNEELIQENMWKEICKAVEE